MQTIIKKLKPTDEQTPKADIDIKNGIKIIFSPCILSEALKKSKLLERIKNLKRNTFRAIDNQINKRARTQTFSAIKKPSHTSRARITEQISSHRKTPTRRKNQHLPLDNKEEKRGRRRRRRKMQNRFIQTDKSNDAKNR